MINLQNNTKKGFTLIELMIATTLFSIIMLMGVGSLVVSSNSAKSAQKLRVAVDNVNFAMESIARELRTGMYYTCSSTVDITETPTDGLDCPDGDGVIAFSPQVSDGSSATRVTYTKKEIDNSNGGKITSIERCEYSSGISCSSIVSPDVSIETVKFYVNGASISDKIQPSAVILVKGTVTLKDIVTSFSLQTMATQRSVEK